ncbi:hypothetical protein CEXT_337141 [Caerostris extrusa]|uniref:Uncharacterized protein n=1 Tax=Caerostris extrusa TaxID=172846 RepID=A0AAV4RI80_CAEEX|nr:hypothetical protein CEXT_337141 [Caerostris extrusa]
MIVLHQHACMLFQKVQSKIRRSGTTPPLAQNPLRNPNFVPGWHIPKRYLPSPWNLFPVGSTPFPETSSHRLQIPPPHDAPLHPLLVSDANGG